jgi:hypothetical protein
VIILGDCADLSVFYVATSRFSLGLFFFSRPFAHFYSFDMPKGKAQNSVEQH